MGKPANRGGVLVLLLVLSLQAAGQRVVALGDIHGDVDALAAILRSAGLVDANRHWSGGSAVVVQTGDILDRGDQPREVLDFLMELENQAAKSGGRVIALLGNHEFMNAVGDLRYVTPAGFREFSGKDSAQVRSRAYRQYSEWAKHHGRKPGGALESEAEWNERHPEGFIEQRELMSPSGKYGPWLRQRPAVAQVGDVIFVHGGISPALDITGVAELNERIRSELRNFDDAAAALEARGIVLPFFTLHEMMDAAGAELEAGVSDARLRTRLEYVLNYARWYGFRQDGPLWFRGYAEWPDEHDVSGLAAVLARSGAHHIVVGHSIQPDHRIHTRFNGQVFIIDTAMSRFYKDGRRSALEIENGRFTALYEDGRKTLLEPPSRAGQVEQQRPASH